MTIIGTFGSCLSRWTANKYRYSFGGRLITSVYHNRSDQFIETFIEKSRPEPRYEELLRLTDTPDTGFGNEFSEQRILSNQCQEFIGKHMLQSGETFFEALEGGKIRVLLLDNFMDISAKVAEVRVQNRNIKFFSRKPITEGSFSSLTDYLPPETSCENFIKIISYIKDKSPDTKCVFTVFPHNTYVDNERRRVWTERFEKAFSPKDAVVIPSISIPKEHHGDSPSHFKDHFYFVYAGMVHNALSEVGQQYALS